MLSPISILITLLGSLMLIPAIVDFAFNNPDWQDFVQSSAIIMFLGAMLFLASRAWNEKPARRHLFIFVNAIWIVFCLSASLPFLLSDMDISFTDAFFEATSGLTTTGSTILTGLDTMPPGILLWRSMTQWIGGLGIVVLSLSILPNIGSSGQQLFSIESSDSADKPFANPQKYAERITLIYLALTLVCAVAYVFLGMTPFEAANHAMTTISTGGFSTSDASMGHFHSTGILAVSALFMALGGLPFITYIRLMAGRREADPQIKYFFLLIFLVTLTILVIRYFEGVRPNLKELVSIIFSIVSIITTTGFASENYILWGSAIATLFFIITFVGGCSGSTAGGFKLFRVVILTKFVRGGFAQARRPNQVLSFNYGGRRVGEKTLNSVLVFTVLFFATFLFFSALYSLTGLDFETSVSASATALANVGPGIGGTIGPAGNFASFSDSAKWMVSWEMVVGRLELLSVYVVLLPTFWHF